MNTLSFIQVEDDIRFAEYCAGLATDIKDRIEKGEQLDEQKAKWLGQFGRHQLNTCQKLIDAYTVLQVSERLAQHTAPV